MVLLKTNKSHKKVTFKVVNSKNSFEKNRSKINYSKKNFQKNFCNDKIWEKHNPKDIGNFFI